MNIEIQKAVEEVRVVDAERNYWFIRTYGGEMYDDFIERNYVGIGLTNVPYKYIEACKDESVESFENLKYFIENNTRYKKGQATNYTNQLITFQHTVKVGDLVIIPNKNSSKFSIGIIESDVKLVDEKGTFFHDGKYEKFPDKRRKVKWEKTISSNNVRNDLRGMTSTHQAITKVNKYEDGIESYISDIYIKENSMHLIIHVNQDEDINAFDLNDFLNSVTYFYKEFCIENGIVDNRELTIKIKLQSKGKMALKGFALAGVMGIASLILLSSNNEFSAHVGDTGFKFTTGDGLLKSASDFLDRNQEREIRYKIFNDSIEKLKVESLSNDITNDTIEQGEANNGKDNGDSN